MRHDGFTLIELSIVLVIIGLIIGGVLVGQDLIKAAEIRSTASQLEKFRVAANTFKLKYGHLPGDIPPTTAAAFGFFQANSGTQYGDGMLNTGFIEEGNIFWRHLTDASLIEGQFGTNATNPLTATGAITNGTATDLERLFYPEVKAVKGVYWIIRGPTSRYSPSIRGEQFNDFHTYNVLNELPYDPLISPILAHKLDSKIDDGKPNSGNMIDRRGANGLWSNIAADGNCTYGGSGDELSSDTIYNINPTNGGNSVACNISINAGF